MTGPGKYFLTVFMLLMLASNLHAGELEIRFLYKRAVSLLKDHEYQDAKSILLKIVKLNPNIPEIHNNLGYVFERLLDWDSAETAYNRALTLRKSYFACKNNLANIYLKKKIKLGKALGMLGELVRKYPDNSDVLDSYGWATFLFDKQNSDIAEEYLKKAIFFNIRNYWAQHHLGVFYIWKKDYRLAEKFLKKAIESVPSVIRDVYFFRYYLFRCYRLSGQLQKAEKLWEVIREDFENVTQIIDFKEFAGYRTFFELIKVDVLCQYKMSLLTGFTNIVRKYDDEKVILDSDINLKDIKDYTVFKGIADEAILFSKLLKDCSYRVDAKGKVVCSVHGYCRKHKDVSGIITDYYSEIEKYTEIMNMIKSTELGNGNK